MIFFTALSKLQKIGIKTNIHFLLDSTSIETAINWLKNPPNFLEGVNAIIFLNYKPVGKDINIELLLNKSPKLEEFFKLISHGKHNFKFGFDSCTISYISSYISNIDERFIESCESGRFSAFIDENSNLYPCSFMMNEVSGINLKNNKLKDVWMLNDGFKRMRRETTEDHCIECDKFNVCNGGCHIFKEINNRCMF